jgi:hypothetical protein
MEATRKRIPRGTEDDYTRHAAEKRQAWRTSPGWPRSRSGFAGPLLVDGEDAQGEFTE